MWFVVGIYEGNVVLGLGSSVNDVVSWFDYTGANSYICSHFFFFHFIIIFLLFCELQQVGKGSME